MPPFPGYSYIFLYLPESVPDLNDIENLIQWFIERDRKNVINGFETLNLDEIVAGVKPNNVASISVLEKIDLVYQNTIEKVPKGCEFYLGEFYYSIKKNQYLINKV